ncbi:LysR family transcriptional regulator [Marinomonas colpomeniae]|uniref:LysR family transcriptional regulator n=1 Tax=Marinomonas colpomeniae TaxID=2774408 RepID=A0ABR8P0Y3_9GAMM|nr:LysR family transcriptional regulator [Marinomonas colpomeniae]MBD5771093.1 LysR family transcriptional regulator [Marinomonas colpomeniae]
MDIDISQLRLLVVLERERSLSKAAKTLYISQSAASHILSKLRIRFDDPLFIKTKQGMEPTPTALSLIPDLRKGLNTLDLAFNRIKPFKPKEEAKTFYIGAIDYFEFFALPQLAERLQYEAPNIRIGIEILPENLRLERVEEGRLDLFIGVDNVHTMPRYYHRHHWLTDSYVAIVREDSNLPEKIDLRTFLETAQIHLPLANSGADLIDAWLLEQHQSRHIAMIVQSYAIGGMVTAKSDYLMCVPRNIAEKLLTMLPIRTVELPDDFPQLSISLFSHQLYDSQESVQWLIKQIQQCES